MGLSILIHLCVLGDEDFFVAINKIKQRRYHTDPKKRSRRKDPLDDQSLRNMFNIPGLFENMRRGHERYTPVLQHLARTAAAIKTKPHNIEDELILRRLAVKYHQPSTEHSTVSYYDAREWKKHLQRINMMIGDDISVFNMLGFLGGYDAIIDQKGATFTFNEMKGITPRGQIHFVDGFISDGDTFTFRDMKEPPIGLTRFVDEFSIEREEGDEMVIKIYPQKPTKDSPPYITATLLPDGTLRGDDIIGPQALWRLLLSMTLIEDNRENYNNWEEFKPILEMFRKGVATHILAKYGAHPVEIAFDVLDFTIPDPKIGALKPGEGGFSDTWADLTDNAVVFPHPYKNLDCPVWRDNKGIIWKDDNFPLGRSTDETN